MERKVRALVLASTAAISCMVATLSARADDDNENACGAVLCLAGLMQGGNGGRECSQYEANYFSIVRYHHGHFDLSGTSNARGDFLNQCRSVGNDQKGAVNSKYGGVENGP
ncbi:TrbM/KikA/MpfK family conjugal transfer protein [Paraburkholderia hospita]|uniref:Killer protein, putative n=1 Tax=Paraburkholderia hospita TaxID=169430 RepID=A0ABN0F4D8_9BURK|nr:TrbM/KikA/MpfK family conjugal transfer protein [Paraburkholderia hospita]AXF05707.1 killer protein [Paraburkholderia hospita]EIM93440.1 killer protein, putative [Paraburkholderia hospita]OUL84096.1 killer protein [Paraburkholderia hospita]